MSETDWIYDTSKTAVAKKPRRAARTHRPKELILAERDLSLEQRYYLRMLTESTTFAEAERRMAAAGYTERVRETYWRWRQNPKFAVALGLTQDWVFQCSSISKSRLMLDAEQIKQEALTPKDILYKGEATGHKELELGTALRAVEFQGKGLGITDPDQRGVKVNIDIDFSGRAAGLTIEGESETLAVD